MTLTIEKIKQRIFEQHGDVVQMDETTFKSAAFKTRFFDKDYGEWWTRPHGPMTGQGHPKRGREMLRKKLLLSIDEVLNRLKQKHGENVSLDVSTYVDMKTKAKFIDRDFGEWWAKPGNIINVGQEHKKRSLQKRILQKPANTLSIENIKKRIQNKHGDLVTLDESSYCKVNSKARFIDKHHGEFTTYVGSVLKGVRHPNTTHEKWLNSCKSWKPIKHWKTFDDCQIQSGYEHAVVSWLNKNQIDFDWQIIFTTPFVDARGVNRIYIVDVFIKSGEFANTFIEIKGTWNTNAGKIGKMKWEWFHEKHSNSLIWLEKDLISLGVFTSGKTYLRKNK